MWLLSGSTTSDSMEVEAFSKWLLQVGEGKLWEPNNGFAEIDLPPEILIKDFEDPIMAIVESTYPNFIHNSQSYHYLQGR